MKKPMYYDETFKEQAVKLSCEKGNMDAARELGISYSSIIRWRKKYGHILEEQKTKTDTIDSIYGAFVLYLLHCF